ncbi:mercury(II) reductase [Alicyclobacillus tolerans]|uniref:mercury(II) reductase n=1 Tax=Alicyclobacillus tolerans TaxID=90970 RepID=UPI001F02C6D2|nr:mercury(II) reductase [Alicyclobacillus tolerans]MCF8565951.1 mercury(II) reductase [Alicyclobacillus tolerans]
MTNYRMKIEGMTCTSCERHVEHGLKSAGARDVSADFQKHQAVFGAPTTLALDTLFQSVRDAGYHPIGIEILSEETSSTPQPASLDDFADYDLVIFGSGSAAFSAAIQAVSYEAKVAMVERGTIGGTCVNIGCVPSKALLRAGEIYHLAKKNPFPGLQTSIGSANLSALVAQKDELVAKLRQQKYVDLIDEYGFELISGEARFVDEKTIEVGSRRITAKNFLIASGASPAIPDISGLHDVDYLTSTTALELQDIPKRLAVIGSGYIAMELGQFFHNLGAEVTLMQRSTRLLKNSDPEISETVTQALTEQRIQVVTGATFHKIEQDGSTKRVYVTVDGEEQVIEAEQLLIATGRQPNTNALHLEAANVKLGAHGEVLVDEYLRTSNPRIYAAGDVTMGPQFVYVAAHEGWVVAENAVGGANQKRDLRVVPGVTFTNPCIATVGLTEAQAKAQGYEVVCSVLPLDTLPRALVNRETTGVFKLVADARTRKILGAHIVAENAGDVIYAAVLAIKFDLTIEDLRGTLAPYLTMAEGLKLTALTFDKDVSKLSCCAG